MPEKLVKKTERMKREEVISILGLSENKFHPLVFINGEPELGENVSVGFFSEVNAKGGHVFIGNNCDIASFVSINVADSHELAVGISDRIKRGSIVIENNVFVGSHSFICGDVRIGHHSVVGAGTIVINSGFIPPYSLVIGNPATIKPGYYQNRIKHNKSILDEMD